MKVSKTMFMVLLTVFCLAIMVVSAIPSLSSVGGYDPQYDVNHDGTIDMRDLGAVARDFSPTSTGNDPTLPVNVTDNWAEGTFSNVILAGYSWTFHNNTAGFREVTVSVSANETSIYVRNYEVSISFKRGTLFYLEDNFLGIANSTVITKTYEVTGSQISIEIDNPGPPIENPSINATISIFMTA